MRGSRYQGFRSVTVAAIVSLAFVLLGHHFVLQRTFEGPTQYQTIRGDTLHYLAMVQDGADGASPPFKYRPLVPLIAKLMPLPAAESLRAISYGSLFVSYFAIQLACLRLRINQAASIAGLLVLFASSSHLYNYHNPFLVDAFALAALSVMLCGFVSGSFLVFATAAMLGVLARETSILLVPLWLLRDFRRGIPLTIAASALVIIVRVDPSYDLGDAAANALELNALVRLSHPLLFGEAVILSWGSAWLITVAGLCLFTGRHFVYMVAAFLALFCGAFLTSLLASDLARMFLILSPVVALASAQYFMRMMERRLHVWVLLLVAILVGQGVVAIPNAILGEILNGARLLKLTMLVATLFLLLSTIVLLRADILAALGQNREYLTSRLRRRR